MTTTRAPRRDSRRLILTAAWAVLALSFVHLALDSTRPRSVDLHGLFAAIAAGALALAIVTALGRWPRTRLIAGVLGALVAVAAAGLIVRDAAHETGVLIVLLGLGIAVLSLGQRHTERRRTGDSAG